MIRCRVGKKQEITTKNTFRIFYIYVLSRNCMLELRTGEDIKIISIKIHNISLVFHAIPIIWIRYELLWIKIAEAVRLGRGRCLQLTQFSEDHLDALFLDQSAIYVGRLSILLSYHLEEWRHSPIQDCGDWSRYHLFFCWMDVVLYVPSFMYLYIYMNRQQLYVQTNFSSRALPVQWPDESKRRRWWMIWRWIRLQIWQQSILRTASPAVLFLSQNLEISPRVIAIRPLIYVPLYGGAAAVNEGEY